MKKLRIVLLWIVGIIVGLALAIFIAFKVSVKPGVYIISKMFDQPVVILDEARYQDAASKVEVLKDVPYDSTFNDNIFDLYYPKNQEGPLPVLIWVHGGGYVSGNKEGIAEFATYIAADNEIAIVAMNYEKAPQLQYPGQVKQVEELVQFLRAHKDTYPMIDLSTILFGGDSAGAQIAAQYVAIQTNTAYARELDMKQTIGENSIHGFISYSGPIDIQQMTTVKSDDRFMKFFVNTVARALIGTRDWKESMEIKQASVKEYITEDFPPTYITDGNAFSFQEQGMAFEEKLKSLNIPVQSLFFNEAEKEIVHEYQFNYELEEAKESLQQTIDFIDEQVGI
ncbi:alpha/beta hydrolase [Solibacillus sp. FSL K6-1523]|uniref:alpha/beta hydrolase n=1 Tax=Solibacillus sp. FSL K6-1523 TaxID=2921471 RepID=UPI0030F86CB6